MKVLFFRSSVSFLLFFLAMNSSCKQTQDATIGSLLDSFQELTKSVMAQATRTSDALTMRVANEMEITVKNLFIQFDGRYNDAVTRLGDEERKVLDQLHEFEEIAKSGVGTVRRTEELLNLDLIKLTDRFTLFSKPIKFYVSSVNGISIKQSAVNHEVEIVGIGFGYSNNNIKYIVDVFIDGRLVPSNQITHKSDKELAVNIPTSFYAKKGSDTLSRFIPATFLVKKVTYKSNGKVDKSERFSMDFFLTILPKFAALIEVEEVISTTQPKDTLSHDLQFAVAESSKDHPNVWSQQWTCPDNAKIYKVEFPLNNQGVPEPCIGSGCGWCSSPAGGGSISYFTNGTTVTVQRACIGPACQYVHRIFYITYGEKPKIIPGQKIKVILGEQFHVLLDQANTKHEYTIRGRSYLGSNIYLDNYSEPQGSIRRLGSGDYAGRYRVNLIVE